MNQRLDLMDRAKSAGSKGVTIIPESEPTSKRVEHGLCIQGGEDCYLCDQPIRAGETIVSYRDATFWGEQLFYHADCWVEADLAAKEFGGEEIHEGKALELADVLCARCSETIDPGDVVVRVPGGEAVAGDPADRGRALPRVLHAACFDAVKV